MIRRSTIEDSPDREKIEFDLATGKSIRNVATKYGLSRSAVHRHSQRLPAHLRAANLAELLAPAVDLDQLRHEESRGLLAIMANQRIRLLHMQDDAIAKGEHGLAVKIAAQIHRGAELIGQYLGEFAQVSKSTSISVVLTPQFSKLRRIVIDVLQKHPEALADFTSRMQAFEAEELGAMQAPPQLALAHG